MSVATRKNFLGLEVYESSEDEPYMSQKQRLYFHQLLQLWHKLLLSETDDFKLSLQAAEIYVDDVDRAAYEEAQSMSMRSSDRRRKLQKKVSEAIGRIQAGEYGFCTSCGDEIGLSRLTVRPTADQCINCKTVAELYEKRS